MEVLFLQVTLAKLITLKCVTNYSSMDSEGCRCRIVHRYVGRGIQFLFFNFQKNKQSCLFTKYKQTLHITIAFLSTGKNWDESYSLGSVFLASYSYYRNSSIDSKPRFKSRLFDLFESRWHNFLDFSVTTSTKQPSSRYTLCYTLCYYTRTYDVETRHKWDTRTWRILHFSSHFRPILTLDEITTPPQV
jgi:hypothetical protein